MPSRFKRTNIKVNNTSTSVNCMNHKVSTHSVNSSKDSYIHAPARALKTLSHVKLLYLGYKPNSQYRHLDLLHS
jgi:hypothetical protein